MEEKEPKVYIKRKRGRTPGSLTNKKRGRVGRKRRGRIPKQEDKIESDKLKNPKEEENRQVPVKRWKRNLNRMDNQTESNTNISISNNFNQNNIRRNNIKKIYKKNFKKGVDLFEENLPRNLPLEENKIKDKFKVDDYIIYEYDGSIPNNFEPSEEADEKSVDHKGENENESKSDLHKIRNESKIFDIPLTKSSEDTFFSKIIEVDDLEEGLNYQNTYNLSNSLNHTESKSSPFSKEKLTVNNKIFNLEKIINKNKFNRLNECNENYNKFQEKTLVFNENNSPPVQEKSLPIIDTQVKYTNVNFNTYKPQIKINNYFIKHKSLRSENQNGEESDKNSFKKYLTKPCIICEKARFARNELLKLQNLEEFILCFKYFTKQVEFKIEEGKLNESNREIFENNKKTFDEYFDKTFRSNIYITRRNFRRGKRICIYCFQKHIEENPVGASYLIEFFAEEDEKPELDESIKNEIVSEIKKFMYMNGYDIDKSFPIFSNSLNLTEENFNIFNVVFGIKKSEQAMTNNHTEFLKEGSIFNSNNNKRNLRELDGNYENYIYHLSNFNDKSSVNSQKWKRGNFKNNSNLQNGSFNILHNHSKYKENIDLNEKSTCFFNNKSCASTMEILKNQCDSIKNMMAFEQLVFFQIMGSVDEYIQKLTLSSRNIQISANFLYTLIQQIAVKKEEMKNDNQSEINKTNLPRNFSQECKENFGIDAFPDFLNTKKNEIVNDHSNMPSYLDNLELNDPISILDNLNKLLILNSKISQLINFLNNAMNRFAIYSPFFFRNFTKENFMNFQSPTQPHQDNLSVAKIQNPTITDNAGEFNMNIDFEQMKDSNSSNKSKRKISEIKSDKSDSNIKNILLTEKNLIAFPLEEYDLHSEKVEILEDDKNMNAEIIPQNDPLTFPIRPMF